MKKRNSKNQIVLAYVVYDMRSEEASIITTDDFENIDPFILKDIIGDMEHDLSQLSSRAHGKVLYEIAEIMAKVKK